MKKYLTTFPINTGKKKRLITTYRSDQNGQLMRAKHVHSLNKLERYYPSNNTFNYAYTKGKSIKQLVSKHLSNSYFYQFDISNFFASIDHQILLLYLTNTDVKFNTELIYECSNARPNGLALGLVPSPYLSNIYLTHFDYQLAAELKAINPQIEYTRYSDDLTISAPIALDLENLEQIISSLLAPVKLVINSKKTKSTALLTKGQHIKVLGLNIIRGECSNYITVGRKFKRNASYEPNIARKKAMNAYINYNQK